METATLRCYGASVGNSTLALAPEHASSRLQWCGFSSARLCLGRRKGKVATMQLFIEFLLAVLEEWKGWLAGGLPMVVLAVIGIEIPISVPLWEWTLLVFVAGLIVAMFRVYRAERTERRARQLWQPDFDREVGPKLKIIFCNDPMRAVCGLIRSFLCRCRTGIRSRYHARFTGSGWTRTRSHVSQELCRPYDRNNERRSTYCQRGQIWL